MAGIRIGIIYASVEIIAVLNKIKPPYNINALSQNAAIKHLENQITTKKQIEILKEQKKLLINTLSKKHFVKKIYDSDANFILLKVDDANQRYSQILADGFVVRNRTNDLLCNNCIRISIGTETENKKLITILNHYN
jgi:histidinol-phosphate aminotransferase